ncbi:MAG: hypothetical protein AB7F59_06200 [Bdellovibrionales bacterium]
MGLLKKIQILKRSLIVLVSVNIFVLITAFVAAYNYYQSKYQLEAQWDQKQSALIEVQNAESEIYRLSLLKPQTSDQQYAHRRDSEKLSESLLKLGVTQKSSPERLAELHKISTTYQSEVKSLISLSTKTSSQAAIVGFFTLVFGIILPLLISFWLTRSMLQAKRDYEAMVAQWITSYLQGWQTAGDKPFQDPFFWMNLVIATVEIFGPQSKHPAMQILSEFAPVIKREINK